MSCAWLRASGQQKSPKIHHPDHDHARRHAPHLEQHHQKRNPTLPRERVQEHNVRPSRSVDRRVRLLLHGAAAAETRERPGGGTRWHASIVALALNSVLEQLPFLPW